MPVTRTTQQPLKMFSWGYWGWGNATLELRKAVDAVERSRGFKPPIFVDVRLKRSVRAVGFNGNAFGNLLGEGRYHWINRLGNERIGTGQGGVKIADPSAAPELLELAIEADKQKRRVIFFCSCEYLRFDDGFKCHRWNVGTLLLKAAEKAELPLQVQEWPGGDSERFTVKLDDNQLKKLWRSGRYVPLGGLQQLPKLAGLPHGSVVRLESRQGSEEHEFDIVSGPTVYRSGQWRLPVYEVYEADDYAVWTESKRLRKQHAWGVRMI